MYYSKEDEDEKKFTYYYNRYYNYAYSICKNILYDKQETDFVLNQVFWKVSKSMVKIADDDAAKAWIGTIARNEAINYNNRTQSKGIHEVELSEEILYSPNEFENSILDALTISESIDQVYEEMKKLKPALANPLILKHQYGFTVQEISDILNKPIKTIYGRLKRGTKILEKKVLQKRRADLNE